MNADWIDSAYHLKKRGEAFVIATVIEKKGSAPRQPGAKMLVCQGETFGTIGGGQLEEKVIQEARSVLKESLEKVSAFPLCFRTGQCCGGAVDVLYELVGVGPELWLFGAGHVGQATVQVMAQTPFHIHLVDERHEWLEHAGLSDIPLQKRAHWREAIHSPSFQAHRSYCLIMTHSHELDEDILVELLSLTERPRYVGLIGSETKWQRFQQRMKSRGVDEALFKEVHCPIGAFDCGSAPQEVAISIGADLLRRHYHP